MTPEEVIAIRSMLMTSEYTNEAMDSTCLMAAGVKYAISQKNKGLTKDIHDNISNTSSQNYESMNAGLEVTQEAVDTEIIEVSDSDSEEEIQTFDLDECEIIDELDFRELEQIPHITVKPTEGQVLVEFMLEEDIEFQERDKYKILELPDKQEIDMEMVVMSKMPVETSCE